MKKTLFIAALAGFGLALTFGGPVQAGDAEAGEKLMKKCQACHTWNEGGKNGIGPNLWGLTIRDPGSVEGYKYSGGFNDAMAANPWRWNDATLDEWLIHQSKFVKARGGNKSKMNKKIKKEEQRADIIEYLKTLQ